MVAIHAINISLGFDLTEMLKPENIPGIKAFLGVENESNLVEAILQAKYKRISEVLGNNGFDIIHAGVSQLNEQHQKEMTTPIKESPKQRMDTTAHEENAQKDVEVTEDISVEKRELLQKLKQAFEEITKENGEITNIKYNEKIINFAPSPEELKVEAGIDDGVIVNVEEEDEDVSAVITYVDKDQNIKFKQIMNAEEDTK
ncbi:hypothetical protein [Limosilactobacillus reuteri]|uniref:hypothetical protein n=1 Tax=Limosilactobacillus reuteri TaxID=1598 RepID=UPI001E4ED8B1|nr:hypothetical protein [Limosilactobacillus reuteri]MCC4466444.1 hypothetical protein [Limosilactobacillus reuteri]MCC4474220.1 hypothetical protein [Limosilactobacillus reuteri]